jgi:cytidylate kinase
MAILSISREYRSGGREIGRAVAQEMQYEFVDKDRILLDLKASGEKWRNLAEDLDEVRPTLWEKFDREYRAFIALMECHIYDHALKDRAVIIGRGSNFLLADIPQALKVRLTAPLEVRVERLMRESEMDRRTALWLIEKTDRTRAGYIQSVYGKHWEDQKYYDRIFDTGIQTFEEVTRILVEALKDRDREATPEARQRLKDLALTARVKSQLFTNPKILVPTLEITHDGQAVVLQGVVHNPKEYHLVEEIARQAADPHPIRNELHYRV